jgi:hypothetical protein
MELAMASQLATLPGMPKKKPRGGKRKPQGRSPAYVVFARVDPRLGEVLEDVVETTRPKTDKTAIVEAALEMYFTSLGKWPPAEEGGDDAE